jgi:hypothetical protein
MSSNPFALLASDDEGEPKVAPAAEAKPVKKDTRAKDTRANRGGHGKGATKSQDRRTKDPRRTIKAENKREGGGGGNWGSDRDAVKEGIREARNGDVPALDVPGSNEEAAEAEEAEAATMGLDEYLASKKSGPVSTSAGPGRKANDGAEAKLLAGSQHRKAAIEDESSANKAGRKKNQRSNRQKQVDITFAAAPRSSDDGPSGRGRGRGGRGEGRGRGRGGRGEGRGRGRGGRGEGRGRGRGGRGRGGSNGPSKRAPNVADALDFPAL